LQGKVLHTERKSLRKCCLVNKFNTLVLIIFVSLNLFCESNDAKAIPINTKILSWGFIEDHAVNGLYHISYFDNQQFLEYSINWNKKEFRSNYGGGNEFITGSKVMDVNPGEKKGPIIKNESVIWKTNFLENIRRTLSVRRICLYNNSIRVIYGTLLSYKHSQKPECNLKNINLKKDYTRFEFRKNLDEEFLSIYYGNYLTNIFHHKKFREPKTRGKVKSIFFFLRCKLEFKDPAGFEKIDLISTWKKIEKYSEEENLTVIKEKRNQIYFIPANRDEFSIFQVCPRTTLDFLQ
jgi:hypothetical protein